MISYKDPKINVPEIRKIQRELHEKFRSVPLEGKFVEYLGREYIVYPSVFWPHSDSMPLVENYTINLGEKVLDVCTGSGAIAINSALKGASKVVALDINPNAVRAARYNVNMHWVDKFVEVRESDVLSALRLDEKFDVVTINPPFTNVEAKDYAEMTIWDTGLRVHHEFFNNIERHLKPNSRIYISQASFGGVDEMLSLAESKGFDHKLIGQKTLENPHRTFYAFELRRAK